MGREPELSTSFFQVLIGDFANKLVSFSRSRSSCEIWLPCCLFSTLMQFCYMFEIHVLTVYTTSICEEAKREVACNPSAPNWMRKIMGCDDWTSAWSCYCFGNGWVEFVNYHNLQVGDFLVFELIDESTFQVSMFDQNCCEKELMKLCTSKPRRGWIGVCLCR